MLRERAADVDAFVAINRYYADFMADYLAVDRARIHVIPHGLKLEGHGTAQSGESGRDEPRVIGYLARICEDKGLHLLVDACEQLATRNDVPPFVLHAAGYLGEGDRPYLADNSNRAPPPARSPAGSNTSANSTAPKKSRSCNRSTCSARRPSTANRKACPRWKQWPTPCPSCCPTTAASPK